MLRIRRALQVSAATLLVAAAHASDPPFFSGIGDLPGGLRRSSAQGVAGDGRVVCGFGTTETGAVAARWTLVDGLQSLGDLPGGGTESGANGVSADGSLIVGVASSANGYEAFTWTAVGGMLGMGFLPGGSVSKAIAASADGSVIVGSSSSALSGPKFEAFRWTAAGGMQPLGDIPGSDFDSVGISTSADGSRVCGVGISPQSAPNYEAALWTTTQPMTGLGDLPGGVFTSVALAISGDGKVVVGNSVSESGSFPCRWDEPAAGGAGPVSLGDLAGGGNYGYAYGVSYDGSVIVGNGESPGVLEAFVWTATTGSVQLQSVLTGLGLDLSGWTLKTALAISADGRTIVGFGINSDGNQEGWVAFLGDPWTDVGQGLAGVTGVPALAAHGTLLEGHPLTVSLTGAKPSGSATLVVGFSAIDAPFKGGTMVPDSDVLVAGLPLDGAGALSLSAAWPAGVPSGTSLWLQAWIPDAASVKGFAASNATLGVVP